MIKITHEPMAQGGWVAIYEDITERHRAEQSIAHMARHDALTDLPNRVLFREQHGRRACARRVRSGETLAVLCLDLDNFKGVNDTLGHPIGDKLLGTIAERVRGAVGEGDTIARLGGDEFAILQANSNAARRRARSRAGWSRSSPSRSRSTGRRSIPASASASRSRRTTAAPPTT